MDDQDFDPVQEEAEDRDFLARQKRTHDERAAALDARQGILRLSERPRKELIESVKRSIPGSRDAHRLFDLVIERLGERAELDVWSAPFERCLLLREEGRPGWYLPQRLITMVDEQVQPSSGGIGFTLQVPPRLQRRMDRMKEWEAAEAAPKAKEEAAPLSLSPGGQPGRLRVQEGSSSMEIVYDERGAIKETSTSMGDFHGYGDWRRDPFSLDTLARPPQPPPISILLDPSLQPEGIPLDRLAELVCAVDLAARNAGRVWMPCPQPGTVTGSWRRGLQSLREAEWRGEVGEQGGWVVIDGWNGTALVVGPDRDQAFAAWQEEVRALQPLPPVPPPVRELPEPEPEPEPPESPPDEDVMIASTGLIEFRVVPPVDIPWPAPRPENVAAVALPLPALPGLPPFLARQGFSRALRLWGEHGEVGFTFLREESDGLLLVGDDAVEPIEALGFAHLEQEMDRIAAEVRESLRSFPRGSPDEELRYSTVIQSYLAWDWLGRSPEIGGAGTSWSERFSFQGLGPDARHKVIRVRFRSSLAP